MFPTEKGWYEKIWNQKLGESQKLYTVRPIVKLLNKEYFNIRLNFDEIKKRKWHGTITVTSSIGRARDEKECKLVVEGEVAKIRLKRST